MSSVRRWWRDPALRADAEPETARRGYVASVGDLTVLADARSGRAAYNRLVAAGLFKGAYSTYMRGLRRTDPALLGTAIEGWPGLLKNRPYLDGKAPHRGHTLHLDHTQLDVFVWPSHRHHQPVKPWVTGVADSATGLLMVVPWELDVTDQKVSAALLSWICHPGIYDERLGHVDVGGLPEQVVFDNAAQHFGPTMRAAIMNLGLLPMPTDTYSSYQNGVAERSMLELRRRGAELMPGTTKGPVTREGGRLHVARRKKDIREADVLTWNAFCVLLGQVVDEINTEIVGKDGLTRLQRWAADPTEIHRPDPDEVALSMLPAERSAAKATKEGIHFRSHRYQAAWVQPGRRYQIRYLPGNDEFIACYLAETGGFAGFAQQIELMNQEQRNALLAARHEQETHARAILTGAQAKRRYVLAAANAEYTEPPAGENADAPVSRLRRAAENGHKPRKALPARRSTPDTAPRSAPKMSRLRAIQAAPTASPEQETP